MRFSAGTAMPAGFAAVKAATRASMSWPPGMLSTPTGPRCSTGQRQPGEPGGSPRSSSPARCSAEGAARPGNRVTTRSNPGVVRRQNDGCERKIIYPEIIR
jgi:hypothetical protein